MIGLRHSYNLKCLASQVVLLKKSFLLSSIRNSSSKEAGVQELPLFDDLEDPEEREAEIERKRNKSRLRPRDYCKQNNQMPLVEEPEFAAELSHKRRMYGKYGKSSEVNPSILWPSKVELQAMKEYEAVLQPYTVQELISRAQIKKNELELKRSKIENEILEKVKKSRQEILEFHKRVAQKKKDAIALKEKNDQLVEEVRKFFGYKINIADPKFKELLAKKQKEEKKKKKEARHLAKMGKLKSEEEEVTEKSSEEKEN